MGFDWNAFLGEWSQRQLANPTIRAKQPADVIETGWMGYEAAALESIITSEKRLGICLPNSYREFLMVSNGWRYVGDTGISLNHVEEIEWFSKKYPEWYSSYVTLEESDKIAADYFEYEKEQDTTKIRFGDLRFALAISSTLEGAIYLLNAKVINECGEWEGWFFANWLPGAVRYRTFADMLKGEAL